MALATPVFDTNTPLVAKTDAAGAARLRAQLGSFAERLSGCAYPDAWIWEGRFLPCPNPVYLSSFLCDEGDLAMALVSTLDIERGDVPSLLRPGVARLS